VHPADYGPCQVSNRLASPHKRCFLKLPHNIQNILVKRGFTPAQQDGELLSAMCIDPNTNTHADFWADLVLECESTLIPPIDASDYQQILTLLEALCYSSAEGKQTDCYTPIETECAQAYRSSFLSCYQPPTGVQHLLKKWRHWKPSTVRNLQPSTQRALEMGLKQKWLHRLLLHFTAHDSNIPNLQLLVGDSDPHKEYARIFGDTRWRTLRLHVLSLEEMLKHHGLHIPWAEDSVRATLNSLESKETPPNKITRFWLCLKWFGSKLGLLDPDRRV
jgi:hypothetical protein